MNIPEKLIKILYAVGVLLAIFLAVLSIKEFKAIGYVGRIDQVNVISVNATGEAFAIPDIATFSFTVTERAKTVVEAQKLATDRTNNAIKAVKDAGVAEKDVKTTSYNISPHYDYVQTSCVSGTCTSGKSVLVGYDVSQTIEIKVRDLSKAGAIFGTIGSIGVQNVNGLTFAVDDIDSIKAKAREKAIDNAQAKAKQLAKQLGVSLDRITSFYDSSDYTPPIAYGMGGDMRMEKAVAISSPQIPSGEQKIVSTVTITYEIK